MTNRAKGTSTKATRRPRLGASDDRRGMAAAELERMRFRDLAYRLVHCTDPEEQQRLKGEVVRSILRRRGRPPEASGDIG